MKNKSTLPIVLAVLNVIACLVMNFQEFLMGSPAYCWGNGMGLYGYFNHSGNYIYNNDYNSVCIF
ncbi:hypothetical protein EDD66_102372 [Mobilisporobacter senegalensis]|uniref:Uncharacterized protein n=1 Tax=Mobilisporobacter senegalensis TaxID=1329262 RepID=A0A3N1Y0F4_9FIRM|nr:hypothetical protein [Mobilisporobacter senegalensis]ROR30717.1 hypothetical protein EDD66_102372 [Mobilisporobacter senegalensis]